MEHTPNQIDVSQRGADSVPPEEQLAQAEVAVSEARAAYNEAILGVIVVDRSCDPSSKDELDKTICSCQQKLALARDSRDRLLSEVFSFTQFTVSPASR